MIVPPIFPKVLGPDGTELGVATIAESTSLSRGTAAVPESVTTCSLQSVDGVARAVGRCALDGAGRPDVSDYGLRASFAGQVVRSVRDVPPRVRAGASEVGRARDRDGAWVRTIDGSSPTAVPTSAKEGCAPLVPLPGSRPGEGSYGADLDVPPHELCVDQPVLGTPAISGDGGWTAFSTAVALRERDTGTTQAVYLQRTDALDVAPSDAQLRDGAAIPVGRPLLVATGATEPTLDGNGHVLAFVALRPFLADTPLDLRAAACRARAAMGNPCPVVPTVVVKDVADPTDPEDHREVGPPITGGTPTRPLLDGTGRWLAFTLVTGPGRSLAYLADLDADPPQPVLLSRNAQDLAADGQTEVTGISDGGRVLALASTSTDLVGGAPGADRHGYVLDPVGRRLTQVVPDAVRGATGLVDGPVLSADGTTVAYSASGALVAADVNEQDDVYVQNVDITGPGPFAPIGPLQLASPGDVRVTNAGDAGPSGEPALSRGGGRILFASSSGAFPASDPRRAPGSAQVYGVTRSSSPTVTASAPGGPVPLLSPTSVPVTIAGTGPAVLTVRAIEATGDAGTTAIDVDRRCVGGPIYQEKGCTFDVSAVFTTAGPHVLSIIVRTDPSSSSTATRRGALDTATGLLQSATTTATVQAAQGTLRVSPDPVRFAVQARGRGSSAQRVTVTNEGPTPVTVSSVGVVASTGAGEADVASFSVSRDRCQGVVLGVGARCTVDVVFRPNRDGAITAALEVRSNAAVDQVRVALQGPGNRAVLTIAPAPADFGPVKVGSMSLQTFVVTNSGSSMDGQAPVSARLDGIELVDLPASETAPPNLTSTPWFAVGGGDCRGAELEPGGSCRIVVAFTPGSVGPVAGRLRVTSDAANAPTVALAGRGALGLLRLDPATIDVGRLRADAVPPPVTVTATNTGPVGLDLRGLVVGGADPDHLSVEDGCSTRQLAAGEACTLVVHFLPLFAGDRTAQLTLPNDGTGGPGQVVVHGVVVPILRTVAPTGQSRDVAWVVGRGFLPRAPVRVAWIGHPGQTIAVADATGRVRAGLLVLDRNGFGDRQAAATDGSSPTRFDPVPLDRPYLLVAGSYQPPDLVGRG